MTYFVVGGEVVAFAAYSPIDAAVGPGCLNRIGILPSRQSPELVDHIITTVGVPNICVHPTWTNIMQQLGYTFAGKYNNWLMFKVPDKRATWYRRAWATLLGVDP